MGSTAIEVKTETDEINWGRHCGFLDLESAQFTEIQDRLLLEQIDLFWGSGLAHRIFPGEKPRSVDEFRETVPLTSYSDYADLVKPGAEGLLPVQPHDWAYTVYGAGEPKWVPYSDTAFERLLDNTMAALLLAAAEGPGDVNVRAGDIVMYNVPPRPFLCGLAAIGMKERFCLEGILDPVVSEQMDFKERISAGFEEALKHRVDLIISMTSVLLKVGERLEGHMEQIDSESGARLRARDLNYKAVGRLARARIKSAVARRPVRPRDLWRPKAIVGWGMDTSFSRDRVADYWGKPPFEMYASTEGGVMGMQPLDGEGIVFSPHADYFELIPEAELERLEEDPDYRPVLLLPSEAEPGGVYEAVITNFYGMPFVRYRTGHLVRFLPHDGPGLARLPRFQFIGRSDARIDVAGFTRIDEKTVWDALKVVGMPFGDWTMRSEGAGESVELRIYGEPRGPADPSALAGRLHDALRKIDPLYSDLETMLDIKPMRVTFLPPGTFDRYYEIKRAEGAALVERRPPRMNAGESVMALLDTAASEATRRAA